VRSPVLIDSTEISKSYQYFDSNPPECWATSSGHNPVWRVLSVSILRAKYTQTVCIFYVRYKSVIGGLL
jgi:hypothetical protein